MRLYKLYGDGALELVKSNPYVIASDRIGGQFDEAGRARALARL